MSTDAQHFSSPEVDSVEHLDFLWSEFFATGNIEPVKKIIKVLTPASPYNKPLAEAVEWSLTLHAKQHQRVYEVIKSEAVSATGVVKDLLEQILKDASKN